MKNSIIIQQVLHGYNNGHRMIDSSLDLSFEDRRIMDILSDSAGINEYSETKEYITGYPLINSDYYVIAKTWYADEMQRPGCVWTHSLIIDIRDVSKMGSIEKIMNLFSRPGKKISVDYTSPIEYEPELFCETEINGDRMARVIYTLYSSNANKYIEISLEKYENEIIRAIECMDIALLRKFSFCSNTCVNRRIENRNFVYQMFSSQNTYKVCSKDEMNVVFYPRREIHNYPIWVKRYVENICKHEELDWKAFYLKYFDLDVEYKFYNQLFRLFLVIHSNDLSSMNKFYNIITKIFDDKAEMVKERTFSLFLYDDYYDAIFKEYYIELIEMMNKLKKRPTKKDFRSLAKKIVDNNLPDIFPLLEAYAHGELKTRKKELICNVIQILEPNSLEVASHMKREIVLAMIASNPRLIMSKAIWRESREFQCEAIGALPNSNEGIKLIELLELIVTESEHDVSKAVYHKMGKEVISSLYEMIEKYSRSNDYVKEYWDEILLADMEIAVKHLLLIPGDSLRNRLLLKLNTYDEKIQNMLTTYDWILLFKKLNFEQQNDEVKRKVAIAFLPIVLGYNRNKYVSIAEDIYETLHKQLAWSEVSYDDWIRFEYLLPEVEPYFAWDRCLRLRKAFGKE